MRFLCPNCSSLVSCLDTEVGATTMCAECLRMVAAPVERCAPGVVLGDFVIKALVGTGGMGTVYLAEQISLQRPVALKVLHAELAESPTQLQRFLDEARMAASIHDPNLIGVYAVGSEDGLHFIAMEFVKGVSLHGLIERQGKLPLGQAVDIAVRVASGLQAAWDRRGIVHCDIKPENILIPEDGGVKIADLGLAARLDARPEQVDTLAQEYFAGSPYYVCPEVILGRPPDHRSDLYSLGACFFEMLTGRPPFEGTDAAEVAARHLYATPPDPCELIPELPPLIGTVVTRLLAKDPDERFQTAAELRQALQVDALLRADAEAHAAALARPAAGAGARWQCPSCGRGNDEASRYCLDCGAYGWRPCPMCGNDLPVSAQFCTQCGGNLLEQRQGVVRNAQHLLNEMHEAINAKDYETVGNLVAAFRKLDQHAIPEIEIGRYHDVANHLKSVLDAEVKSARDGLRVDRLEAATARLVEVFGDEAYEWLKGYVAKVKSDLAQIVYQAGAAFNSNCLATCRRFLADSPQWRGGSFGNRIEELGRQCDERLKLRTQAIREAKAVLAASPPDYCAAARLNWRINDLRVSKKVLVVTPSETDTKANEQLDGLAEGLDALVRSGVERWLQEENWGAMLSLLDVLKECEANRSVAQESFVTASLRAEIRKRHQSALDAERAGDVRLALSRWNRLLQIPERLLPNQLRREAVTFPMRRARMHHDQRRPIAKSNLSTVFSIWCMAVALAALFGIRAFFDETLTADQFGRLVLPLLVQVALIGSLGRFLRSRRVLAGSEMASGLQPSVFALGVALLWIVSPLTGVLGTVQQHASVLFEDVPLLASAWLGPALMLAVWLIWDLVLLRRCRSLVTGFSLSLSWIIATGVAVQLWGKPPDAPLLHLVTALVQGAVFALIQGAGYWWNERQRPTQDLHPALAGG